MKMQNVPLGDIVNNPWRDVRLYPIDDAHVAELQSSINDHGFFGGIKGRRRNGKVEIGCGHARIAAARKVRPKLETVAIFIEDMDDDAMLRLMTDENATQAGANPGAVMNEVGAVTRRIIEGLLTSTIVEVSIKKAFDGGDLAIKKAIGKLRNGDDVHLAIGQNVIARYLGQGDPARSLRSERQIREAIAALKQSGRYDAMVEEAVRKHSSPVAGKKAGKGKGEVETTKAIVKRAPVLDERTANLFPNEHQFSAFREAVTSPAAQKVIPVSSQYAMAKSVMGAKHSGFKQKQVGAPFIRKAVQGFVQDGMKAQRSIDKEEREQYMREQNEARIDGEINSARSNLRSLLSSLARLMDLADEFPAHPKLGGFSARLDTLVAAIQQFSRKLK